MGRKYRKLVPETNQPWLQPARSLRMWTAVGAIGVAAVLGYRFLVKPMSSDTPAPRWPASATTDVSNSVPTLSEAMLPCNIAYRNLLCADRLAGSEGMAPAVLLRTLSEWAERVRAETDRHLYRYQRNPAEFDNSEAYFRMLMMAVVVAEDLKVRYNPELAVDAASTGDQFFADSQNVFLHGLLGERRLGTCSSMPVLYVALGRRLGYPVCLVATKGHLFVRWESAAERLNLEATGRGMNHYDDDHYRHWPFKLSDVEIAENGYLKSMTPEEELAAFLSIRASCLLANGQMEEARKAFSQAATFAPKCRTYQVQAAGLGPVPSQVGGRATSVTPATPGASPAGGAGTSVPSDPNPLKALNRPQM
jgi:hypothetical protein